MAIGMNDYDDIDGEDVLDGQGTPVEEPQPDITEPDSEVDEPEEPAEPAGEPSEEPEDFITALLKSRGIEDSSKIKFANEDGDLEEVDWDSLNNEDKLNIINSLSEVDPAEGLDASEIQLINAIRGSNLTPAEYIQYLQRSSVESYIQNVQAQNLVFSIDQYSDEELYVMDLVSRSADITEEEAIEALDRAKSNEALFKKLIGALRNMYRLEEAENLQYARLRLEQEAQAQYAQFSEQIEDAIINFKSFSGGDLEMSEEDMNNLYTFITGTDQAGNNWFNKALHDPNMVVQMAYFVLNGQKMIDDINDYYLKQITEVRRESYNKGLNDAAKKDKSKTVYKPKLQKLVGRLNEFNDLDEEF